MSHMWTLMYISVHFIKYDRDDGLCKKKMKLNKGSHFIDNILSFAFIIL